MRYLITGAQGFVGRYLTAAILHEEPASEVLGISRSGNLEGFFSHLSSVHRESHARLPVAIRPAFDRRYRYISANILEEAKITYLVEDFRPDCVFHLASGLRDADHQTLLDTNIQGSTTLINAIASAAIPRPLVIVGSSGGVYGRFTDEQLPLKESCTCEPLDLYSITKLAAEHIVRSLGRDHGMPVIIARIFNIVGAGQDERHVCGRFAAQFRELAFHGGDEVTVGELDRTRDFIDVRDVASALVLLAQRGEADRIYNVGTGIETSIREVFELSMAIWKYRGTWRSSDSNPRRNDVLRHCADIDRLSYLGFKQRYDIRTSLTDIAAYYAEPVPLRESLHKF